jgi:hypothetical protein
LNFENHHNYNCEITTESGKTFKLYSNWLHNQDLDYWQGWQCDAGSTRLYVDKNLNVWSGECKNNFVGHAIDGFEVLSNNICQRPRCTGCTDDLAVKKHKVDNND